MAVGGKGVISVLANILPAEIRKLTDAALAGRMAEATAQHKRLFPLCRGMFVETNPIPIKAALAMAGLCREDLRLPLSPLSEKYRQPLAKLLQEFGVKAKA